MTTFSQTTPSARPLDGLTSGADFELHFGSLFNEGRGLSFPCDAAGRVQESGLSQRARLNYRRALAVIGREYGVPCVRRCYTT